MDYVDPPICLSAFSIFWNLGAYTLGSMLFAELIGNRTLSSKILTGACIICFPMVACTNTYWDNPFSFGFLLAMLSVTVTAKQKNAWIGIVGGSVPLAVTIGIHQGGLSIAAEAGILYLISLLLY